MVPQAVQRSGLPRTGGRPAQSGVYGHPILVGLPHTVAASFPFSSPQPGIRAICRADPHSGSGSPYRIAASMRVRIGVSHVTGGYGSSATRGCANRARTNGIASGRDTPSAGWQRVGGGDRVRFTARYAYLVHPRLASGERQFSPTFCLHRTGALHYARDGPCLNYG